MPRKDLYFYQKKVLLLETEWNREYKRVCLAEKAGVVELVPRGKEKVISRKMRS